MASDSDRPDNAPPEADGQEPDAQDSGDLALSVEEAGELLAQGEEAEAGGEASVEQIAAELGVQKYVHAAFFGAGILAAYLIGKLVLAGWNTLTDVPEAVRSMPFLIEYGEEQRASITLIIGAVVGVLLVLRYYRRPVVKSWATQVAGELARVTWPTKDVVTNGTIVVLVAGVIATFYVAVLDKLWGYLTNLIYGA